MWFPTKLANNMGQIVVSTYENSVDMAQSRVSNITVATTRVWKQWYQTQVIVYFAHFHVIVYVFLTFLLL